MSVRISSNSGLSQSQADTLYVPYTGAIGDVDLNDKNLSNIEHLTLGPQDFSNAFRLMVLSNSGDSSTGLAMYDGGTNDNDFAIFIDGAGYVQFTGAGIASQVNGIYTNLFFGINKFPTQALDVLGTMQNASNNLRFFQSDPDDLYGFFGDIDGSYGNHTYLEINDNAQLMNLNAGSFNFTTGTVHIGQNDLYQTNGMQIGNGSPISIVAEAAYSFKTGAIPSGSFTEGGGRLLSYAINEDQIGSRNTSIVGGIFRMDTRTGVGSGGTYDGNQSFIVFGSPTGGSAFNNRLSISFQTGETLLCADSGNCSVGLTGSATAKLDVNGTGRFRGILTMSAFDIATDTTTGSSLGTATNQKVGAYGSKVVQGGATTDLGVILSNFGIRASGTAYPITTSGSVTLGSLTSTRIPIASTSGLLTDDADLTFTGGDTLNATKIISSSLTASTPVFTNGSKQLISGSFAISQIVASTHLLAQSATVASVVTYTTPNDSTAHSFRVGAYTAITAISAGTLTVTVTFTDHNNSAQTITYFPMGLTSAGLTTTGFTAFESANIRCKANTAITVVSTFTGVSITYDVGGIIESMY